MPGLALFSFALVTAAAVPAPVPLQGGGIEVRFTGTVPGGPVLVRLCRQSEFGRPCRFNASVQPDADGRAVARFADVPAGRYAVESFQDVNRDGRLNFNLMGAPSEPWGYSRGARGALGPPGFTDAAVAVAAGGGVIRVRLDR